MLALWAPQTPRLYRVELSDGKDVLTDSIGFRDLCVDGTKILLNGKVIFLENVDMHAEAPVRNGRVNADQYFDNIFSILANEARKTNPKRLITSTLIGPMVDKPQVPQDDPLMAALDVVGQDEYIGWYEGQSEEADEKAWTFTASKPLIFWEFGTKAKFGIHGGDKDRWTEEQEANVYEHQFAMLRKIPAVPGPTPRMLMDFRSNDTQHSEAPKRLQPEGPLLREDGKDVSVLRRAEGIQGALGRSRRVDPPKWDRWNDERNAPNLQCLAFSFCDSDQARLFFAS